MKNQLRTIILTSFLLNISSYAQNQSSNYVQKFFKELSRNKSLGIDKVNEKILRWDNEDMYQTEEESFAPKGIITHDSVRKYFAPEDINFIKVQYHTLTDSIWDGKYFQQFKLINSQHIREIFKISQQENRSSDNYFYSFSPPLFSEDHNLVILKMEYNCGFLCSTQCIYVFRKKGNSWKEISSWNCWSS